jgi:hypothetical protein
VILADTCTVVLPDTPTLVREGPIYPEMALAEEAGTKRGR